MNRYDHLLTEEKDFDVIFDKHSFFEKTNINLHALHLQIKTLFKSEWNKDLSIKPFKHLSKITKFDFKDQQENFIFLDHKNERIFLVMKNFSYWGLYIINNKSEVKLLAIMAFHVFQRYSYLANENRFDTINYALSMIVKGNKSFPITGEINISNTSLKFNKPVFGEILISFDGKTKVTANEKTWKIER